MLTSIGDTTLFVHVYPKNVVNMRILLGPTPAAWYFRYHEKTKLIRAAAPEYVVKKALRDDTGVYLIIAAEGGEALTPPQNLGKVYIPPLKKVIREHSSITSATFPRFWTPHPPCVSSISTSLDPPPNLLT